MSLEKKETNKLILIKNLYGEKIDFKIGDLKEIIIKILKEKKIKKTVTLFLLNNEEIRKLNKEFLKKDKPTNVLSFPSDEKNKLGDIYISVDYCIYESKETGLTPFELIVFYFIHSLLHLTGYDHTISKKDEKLMRKEELRIFKKIFPEIDLEDEA
ncbi:MAG: rRNA maturation RNase YbeY [Proteobacteria bacterium]|nr:rRNA maturation RNase YbeY [Pseudomonadota bacterium]